MNYQDIIGKVSSELDLSKDLVNSTYRAYWYFIRSYIQSLPLKDSLNEEDFTKLRTSINIPSIGKLCVTWDRFVRCKNRFEIIKKIREKKC